ncbi:MAG: flavin reductase family protein [candidate division Zixibacteria bacterium]|nr:flavin reductase family protein [candidate division Zixibacteria bacterium]
MKKSLGAQTLIFPTPVWIVATYDKNGKANAMAAAWGGVCCSEPPCLAVSLRKATYSYGCIMERKAYTVNVPSENQAREADYFGMASGRNVDKFAATGLTAVKSDLVDAPYIAEFPMIVECRVIHTFEIGLHTQFIGEIMDVKVDEGALNEKGIPDIAKVKPIIYATKMQTYFAIGRQLERAYSIGKEIKDK